ncbi:MAG TPA: CPBP family intramembrane glutamic endopeptidase [Holophagaceae bacterium]|nr:CPBP family intramembrane glutamic endopeptidase [Holophagaceae bacterium]
MSPSDPTPEAPRRTGASLGLLLVLMVAYQLPEGLGLRRWGRMDALALLWLGFYLLALGVGRALGRPGFQTFGLGRAPGFQTFGLGRAPGFGPTFLGLLGAALAAKGLALVLGIALGIYAVGPVAAPGQGLLIALLGAGVTTFIPSVAEDLVTRGLPWRLWPPKWGAVGFVAASAALFVVNHVFRLGKGPMEWAFLFTLGVAYAAALARFDTLWAAVALHWGWNLANALVDLRWDVTILQPGRAPFLSMGAHLLLLGLVLGMPRRSRSASLEAPARPA